MIMKRLYTTAVCCVLLSTAVFAQTKTDSAQVKTADTTNAVRKFTIKMGHISAKLDSMRTKPLPPSPVISKLHFGIIFSRFDLGFSRLVDNGSFNLSPQNQFLNYRDGKTAYVGFDLLQVTYRLNPYFKIYLAGGFDWTLIRLRNNITIQQNTPTLTYTTDNVDYKKNRFSSSYLRIPLAFDFRTKEDSWGNKYHLTFGPEIGFLLNGKVKQISNEFGKKKFYDDYNFNRFRYGAYARLGYHSLGVFAKYYLNDMFVDSPDQKGVKSFNFGLTLGF